MHLYNKEQAIKRMNQFGQHHRPFVFIINYLQDASYIRLKNFQLGLYRRGCCC